MSASATKFLTLLHSGGKKLKKAVFFLGTVIFVGTAYANPVLNNVASGNVTVTQTPGVTTVNQGSSHAIINWQSFNIGATEKTHFQQPAGGVALNRINPTQGVSQIFGELSSTGKIILINQAGIYFGASAHVDVGGLIASTVDMTDQNFLAGKYVFDQPSSYSGSIVNRGTITAADHGLVALVGSSVSNEGMIQANLGEVVLGSGSKFTFDLSGDQLINFTVDAPAASAGTSPVDGTPLKNSISNSGALIANGGKILLTANAAQGVVDDAINLSGVAQAHSVSQQNGEIILSSEGEGTVTVSGKLDASGYAAGQTGGTVKVLGKAVNIESPAVIDASGDIGGGLILIGGNFHGAGPESNALTTSVGSGSFLKADAMSEGNGGQIAVWSDGSTLFAGNISAKGGLASGNGGYVETSGHYLDISNSSVNTLAPQGETGTWLLDPTDVNVVAGNTDTNASLASGTYAPTSGTSATTDIGVSNLVAALNSSNVIVTTTPVAGTGGTGNGDITIQSAITGWTTANSLTLSAFRNIVLNAGITQTTATGAKIVLRADNTGTGIGTISGSGTISMNSGTVAAYYNPTTFGTANLSLSTSGATLTGYMLVNNTTNLQAMNTNLAGNYALGKSLTWTGGSFVPIGTKTNPFMGQFDGLNNTINNLYINTTIHDVGLFGAAGLGSNVSNVGLTNVNITANSATANGNLGTLIGLEKGGSSNNYATGSYTAFNGNVGGLVGSNLGSINNSYSDVAITVAVTSANSFGGLVGFNSGGTISGSYSAGAIIGSETFTGGLVGANLNSGNVSNSYWDTSTSGLATGVGVNSGATFSATGLNTTNMMTKSQLSNLSFAGTWGIVDGSSYAYLSSFFPTTPRAISGYIPTGSLNATGLGNNTVAMAYNGTLLSQSATGVNGLYYFLLPNGTIADSNPFLVYLSGATTKANAVDVGPASGASLTGLNLTANTVQIGGSNTATITNTNLGTARGALNSTDILYTSSGANLTLGNTTNLIANLLTSATTTYNIDGTIATVGSGTSTITASGPTIFSASSGSVTTSGNQLYNDAVTLGANTTLTSSAGTINFANTGTLNLGAYNLTIDNSDANSVIASTISGINGGLTKQGSGTLLLSGASTYTGNTLISAGTLQVGTTNATSSLSALTVDSGATFNLNNFSTTIGSLSGNGHVVLGSGTLTTGNSIATNYSGAITGSGGLNKIGSAVFTLSGDNSYSGPTQVSNGILAANNNSAFGTSAVSAASGTQVQIDANINLAGISTVLLSDATLAAQGATSITANAITLAGTSDTLSNSSNVFTINAPINGSNILNLQGPGSIQLNNAVSTASVLANAALVLNGVNVTTSGSQVYNNALSILAGNSTLQVMNGGSLTLNGGATGNHDLTLKGSDTAFSLSGTLGLNNVSVQGVSGTNSLALLSNTPQAWTISTANTGNAALTGVNSLSFSNIQNITGGPNTNNFIFNGTGSLSGTLNGGTAGSANTLTYAGYTQPVNFVLNNNSFSGTASAPSGLLTTYLNIGNVTGSNNASITLSNAAPNTVVILGANSTGAYGYINDPTNFTSFGTFTGTNADKVVFPTGTLFNPQTGTATINGVVIQFYGIGLPSNEVVPVTPDTTTTNSTVINATYVPTSYGTTSPTSSAAGLPPALTQYIIMGGMVSANLDDLFANQLKLDTVIQKWTTVGCI